MLSVQYLRGVVGAVLYKGNRRSNFHTGLALTEVVEADRTKHRPDRKKREDSMYGKYFLSSLVGPVEHRNCSFDSFVRGFIFSFFRIS